MLNWLQPYNASQQSQGNFQTPLPAIQGIRSGSSNMNWGNGPAIGAANYVPPGGQSSSGVGQSISGGSDFSVLNFGNSTNGLNDFFVPVEPATKSPSLPDKEGGWMQPAQIGLGIARIGLDAYNAINQSKMNKFMQSYYGDQMELMKTDFANAARGSNEALASKRERVLSAQGDTTGTDDNRQGVADYMAQWGAKETV